jgi:hypothetical protein
MGRHQKRREPRHIKVNVLLPISAKIGSVGDPGAGDALGEPGQPVEKAGA